MVLMTDSIQPLAHNEHSAISNEEKFSSNSEAFASDLLENHVETFPWYNRHSKDMHEESSA